MLDMLTLYFQFIKRQYLASFIGKNNVHEMILYSVLQYTYKTNSKSVALLLQCCIILFTVNNN